MVPCDKVRSLAAAALLSSLLLAVSGCADGDAGADDAPSAGATETAGTEATSSAGSVATASSSPSAAYVPASAEGPAQNVPLPVMPEEAKQNSKEGLEAFARHWFDLLNYGYETGDTEPLRSLTGPECAPCNEWYPAIDNGFKDDDWMAGGTIDVLSVISDYVPTAEGRYQVLIQLVQDPIEFYGDVGHLDTIGGSETPVVQMIEASFTEAGWKTDELATIRR